ncbi:MAG: glycoside hydrolase family 3 C-terminal domain-containing protein [Candidatus Izimaplasma sp.]|nr:glycoside hydrolase family 3 C-terminal domain-containing protein [Candidatus Izimaplasma bacterium]
MTETAKHIVSSLTLEEKALLCSGKNFWYLNSINRLDLPEIMVTDGPHGLRKQAGEGDHIGLNKSVKATCFPTASLLASTWDQDLIKTVGAALGEECVQENVSVLLGPGANIKRHPLCGRNFEYFSEDPLLSGKLAAAWIKGVQSQGVGTSLKHYVANNQETMRMVVDTIIDDRTLRELYLKSFEIAVKEAQPWTVMCAYNKVNGTYLAEHHKLLDKVLKHEWQHTGLVVTDWGANNHRVKGLLAGQELEMPGSGAYNKEIIINAIETKALDETVLDKRVERIVDLILKAKPNLDKQTPYDQNQHHQLARRVAAEGMVLLKNKNKLLPLNKNQTVALIGGFAKTPRYQGSGSSLINPHQVTTAFDAFTTQLNDNLLYAKGYDVASDQIDQALIDNALKIAKKADVVVVMVGLTDNYESEGFDRDHLHLPNNHNALIEALSTVTNNIVVTLSNGAPVTMPWQQNVSAIIEQYLGGQGSGQALADVVFGDVNPSGKLAETFPNSLEELPANQDFGKSERQVVYREGLYVGYRAYDSMQQTPLYPFGYGLSYSTFKIEKVSFSLNQQNDIEVTCQITNTGDVFGKEIIQVYVGKKDSFVYRPHKELKTFQKIALKPQETKTIKLDIAHIELAVYQGDEFKVEPGEYTLYVGTSSRNIVKEKTITIQSSDNVIPDALTTYHNIQYPFMPTDSDVIQLLGHDLPQKPSLKPYNFNSTLGEIKETFIGKKLYKTVQKQVKKMMQESTDDVTKNMIEQMLDEMPFRALVMMSNGAISYRRGQGLLDLMNRKFLKGVWKIIKK